MFSGKPLNEKKGKIFPDALGDALYVLFTEWKVCVKLFVCKESNAVLKIYVT